LLHWGLLFSITFPVYHDRYNAPESESADRTAAVQLKKWRTKMMRDIHGAKACFIQPIEITKIKKLAHEVLWV